MDELHHRGQQGIGFALVAAGAGGEDYQRRAQALAATEDNSPGSPAAYRYRSGV
jgi:hypothetical protein